MRPRIRQRTATIVVAIASALGAAAAAQQQTPRFTTGVSILELQANVLDADGRPVSGLGPSDFTVLVGGRERKVLVARFDPAHSTALTPPAATADSSAKPAAPITYAANTDRTPGRVVVIAVDLHNLKAGHERPLLESAAGLVRSLAPQDAVGLLTIPGPSIELTRDHVRVVDALQRIRGTTAKSFRRFSLSVSDAIAFEQGNRRVIVDVVERECPRFMAGCPQELRDAAAELLREARAHILTVASNVGAIASRLQSVDAPKSIVLISGGIPFEQESLTHYLELQRNAARGGVLLYTVQLAQPETDASNMRGAGVDGYVASDLDAGLANIASMTGGRFFHGIGTAKGPFDRIRAAITNTYYLGVEVTPDLLDGKPHDVTVRVNRPGVDVLAPTKIAAERRADTAVARLSRALAQPVDAGQLPIRASIFAVRGDARDSLKAIVYAEVDSGDAAAPQFAIRIAGGGDKAAFESNGAAVRSERASHVLLAAQLPPGRYRMRLAAVDGTTRAGSVELPIDVRLKGEGPLQVSDLIVGAGTEGFQPAIASPPGRTLEALVELYSQDAGALAQATAVAELRRAGDDRVLATAPFSISRTDDPTRRVAQASLSTRDQPAGEYVVTAVVKTAGGTVTLHRRALLR